VKVYTINGILVKEFHVTSNSASLELAALSKGIYLCKVELKTKVITAKFVL